MSSASGTCSPPRTTTGADPASSGVRTSSYCRRTPRIRTTTRSLPAASRTMPSAPSRAGLPSRHSAVLARADSRSVSDVDSRVKVRELKAVPPSGSAPRVVGHGSRGVWLAPGRAHSGGTPPGSPPPPRWTAVNGRDATRRPAGAPSRPGRPPVRLLRSCCRTKLHVPAWSPRRTGRSLMTIDAVRTRRAVPATRSGLLLVGILLIAANLRASITSVGPVVDDIRADLGIGGAAASVLVSLPLVAFAVCSPIAPVLARRIGIERALGAALAVLAVATVVRSLPSTVALWTGTAFLGAAIAVINVVLPSLVKRDHPDHVGQ